MKLGKAIKEMAHRAEVTQKALAQKAGYKTVSSVTTPIAKNDMNVSTLLRIANAVGYDVALVRRKPDPFRPELPIYISVDDHIPQDGEEQEKHGPEAVHEPILKDDVVG